jgi:hemolysin activation/secretion protein
MATGFCLIKANKIQLLLWLGVLLLPPIVNGQTYSPERIIQQEQQRRDSQQKRIEDLQRQKNKRLMILPDVKSSIVEQDKCFAINSVILNGVTYLGQSQINKHTDAITGLCVDTAKINGVLDAITQQYFNAGYITSRAYLPQQNLSSGQLIIEVIEGRIETIVNVESAPKKLLQVFPVPKSQVLNLRELEQGLEQINRLQSYRASLSLRPGSKIGHTIVDVTEKKIRPWSMYNSLSTSGQQATGETQAQLFLSWDDALGLYDYTYLSLHSDIEKSRGKKRSESMALHWSVPWGYWTFGLEATYFEYQSQVQGVNQTFTTSGLSQSQIITIDRLLHRDGSSKTRLNLSVTHKNNKNFIEDVLLISSSRKLAIAELQLQHERYFHSGSQLVAGLSYSREIGSKDPFDKLNLSVDYSLPIIVPGYQLRYQSHVVAQYSADDLFGSEQISIGGQYSVRGYKGNSLSASSGIYWRNDLIWSVPFAQSDSWLRSLTPFISFDVGLIHDISAESKKYDSIKGWAVGFKASHKSLSLGLTYAYPIDYPKHFKGVGEELDFSINFKF